MQLNVYAIFSVKKRKRALSPDVVGNDGFLKDLTVDDIMDKPIKLSNEEKGRDVDAFFDPAVSSGTKKYRLCKLCK